jgi:hypothetical protein
MNPGQSVKDRARCSSSATPSARAAEAGRHHRRGHGRQYRHRPHLVANALGYRPSSSSRDAEPGKEGRAAAARRRAGRGAGRALQEPQQLREAIPAASPKAGATEPNGAIWANQFDNVANRQAISRPPARNLGADRRQGRRLRLRGRLRRHAGRRLMASRSATRTSRSALADPDGRGALQLLHDGELKSEGSSITEGIGQGRITANLEGRVVDDASRSPTPRPCRSSSTCSNTRGCASAARPASTSPAPSAWPGAGAGPHHRHHPLRLRHALPVKLFNPAFLRPEVGYAKDEVTARLMDLVRADHRIFIRWITDEELAANPGLVKSKNVRPPSGTGRIRLVCIGDEASVDSQPCGGTHVSRTGEVGEIHIGKIEKKGRENRRFRIRFGPMPAA